MKVILIVISLLSLISCASTHDEYDIINHFLKEKHIRLENLSTEPYYFKNSLEYFKESAFEEVGFKIQNEKKYKIDTALITNKVSNLESHCITKISKPLRAINSEKILIAVDKKCIRSETLIIFLLHYENNKWVVETNIKAKREYSH
ncbi:hypothetical protein [Bergeyella sp. RCAD1439]|uniref:hypothetical protein n=1 Tax=Bergeyella anatis TaxID=3113737 RepID=UPI002E1920FA|nr:hypothetical protein [Bergeyella sp. RCAD1439]